MSGFVKKILRKKNLQNCWILLAKMMNCSGRSLRLSWERKMFSKGMILCQVLVTKVKIFNFSIWVKCKIKEINAIKLVTLILCLSYWTAESRCALIKCTNIEIYWLQELSSLKCFLKETAMSFRRKRSC